MRVSEIHAEQWLPRPLEELFPFYADAHNLERITPPLLRFRVLTPAPIPMEQGTRIDYRLRLHGIPFGWRTEIAAWEPPHRFVDRQERGPYRLWEHEHTFREEDGGTWVVDHVRCAVLGGALTWRLLVRRDVEQIFRYRGQVLAEMFGAGEQKLEISR